MINHIVLMVLVLVLFFPLNEVYGTPINWTEVANNYNGKQYWDIRSLEILDESEIIIVSKFVPVNQSYTEEIIYRMDIDCNGKRYRDIEVNGITSENNSKWSLPDGDILIKRVIDDSCKKAFT
ncbi:hypothetical protein [Prochlorococcus sp. MIT 0601]|uniref:hypothetical protein n=1 Tax=Prochlorococcus sp. MIT 0601 TaxID=1499498 RepID=UPI0005339595|nr:hypothetical protein [Prochlorococcus sp. MIT 0601]KGG12368.1 hypothetical protein EV05_1580 [Prochlorococcus sp. MIT 0601]